jgi:hypothetical protein
LTTNGKTAFLLLILSVFVPSAAALLVFTVDSDLAALCFITLAIYVLAPSLVCLIFFWYGVLAGEREVLNKSKQWPYWIVIGVLLGVSFWIACLQLWVPIDEEPGTLGALLFLFLFLIAACGYPEGRICSLRKQAKWVAILPTVGVSLFFSSAILVVMIIDPPSLG